MRDQERKQGAKELNLPPPPLPGSGRWENPGWRDWWRGRETEEERWPARATPGSLPKRAECITVPEGEGLPARYFKPPSAKPLCDGKERPRNGLGLGGAFLPHPSIRKRITDDLRGAAWGIAAVLRSGSCAFTPNHLPVFFQKVGSINSQPLAGRVFAGRSARSARRAGVRLFSTVLLSQLHEVICILLYDCRGVSAERSRGVSAEGLSGVGAFQRALTY